MKHADVRRYNNILAFRQEIHRGTLQSSRNSCDHMAKGIVLQQHVRSWPLFVDFETLGSTVCANCVIMWFDV